MVDQRPDYEHCTPDEREVLLDHLLTHRNALLDEALRVILAAGAAEDHRADGALTMADWLVARCNVSRTTAAHWVRAASALESLPCIRARFVAGDLSFEQVRHALGFATPAEDARLAELLPALGCAEIELLAKQRRRARRDDHDDARRRTHLRLRPDRSGLGMRLTGFLPNEDAATVQAALDRRAEAFGPDAETGLWAPHEQRAAGALRDLCAEDLARTAHSGSEPDASMIVVHAPADLLERDDVSRSATVNGEAITNDALRRLLCDARIEVSFDTAAGRTVGVGRATRNPPAWLRRRVIGRDHGRCRWPGCGRAIRHLHHLQHWTKGGPTDASNLMGVCWHHHHLLHEGGWDATGDADSDIHLTSPYGRTLRTRAGPMAA
ncbi:MAG TPA: DUF222 domain-containing protein [Acidimicrobiales bacterium]|jgi:hypothetical protein|nr:DUF222 domain-containing protein [Acidimicrobiales bacterium]